MTLRALQIELGIRQLQQFLLAPVIGNPAVLLSISSVMALGGGKQFAVRSRKNTEPGGVRHAPTDVRVKLRYAMSCLLVGVEEVDEARRHIVDLTEPDEHPGLFIALAKAALKQ